MRSNVPLPRGARRAVAAAAVFAASLAACDSPSRPATKPVLPLDPEPIAGLRAASFVLDVNTRTGTVKVTPPAAGLNANVAGPDFSIVGGDVIELTTSNYHAGLLGQNRPGVVTVTFNVRITNRLGATDLITPTFPTPPAGAAGIFLFPFEATVIQSTGGVSTDGNDVIVELPSHGEVVASPDWDGAAFNWFNDSDCLTSDNDCYRYETYPQPLLGGSSSAAAGQMVGFDVDPTVGSFRARLVVAADLQNSSGSAPVGTVQGAVTSAQRADLGAGVQVTVGGIASGAITYPGGAYSIASIPAGSRTLNVTGLPADCTPVSVPRTVDVLAGLTITENVTVNCAVPTGTIQGTVTRDFDGAALSNVSLLVDPAGLDATYNRTAVTSGAGAYTATGVSIADPPPGSGTISITAGLPGSCTNPGALPYSGLTSGGTLTQNIIVACTAPTPGYNWNVIWTQTGGTVTADVYVDMSGFNDPAVNGTDPDDIGAMQGTFSYPSAILTATGVANISGSLLTNATGNVGVPGTVSWQQFNTGALATGNVGVVRITFTVAGSGTVTQDNTSNAVSVMASFNGDDLLSHLIINPSSIIIP